MAPFSEEQICQIAGVSLNLGILEQKWDPFQRSKSIGAG